MLDLLKFDIGANNSVARGAFADLKKDLTGVKGALAGVNDYAKRTGRGLRNIGAGLTAGITAPMAGLGLLTRNAMNDLSDLRNEAGLAGMDPTGFYTMSLAAEEFGISQTKLADILKDTNDKFGDFAATGAGPLKDFFEQVAPAVGITQDAFKDLSSDDALRLYVSSLEKAGLSQQQMTFYMEALASDSTALLPVFQDNAAALDEMTEATKRLGLNIDTGLLGSAADVERDWRVASKVMGVQFKQSLLGLAPVFADLTKLALPLLESVRDGVQWFSDLSPEVKKSAVVFGGLAAAAGPALMVLGTAASGIGMVTTALTGMGVALMANPILAGIAAVAGGAYLIYRNWEAITGWFADTWAAIKSDAASGWAAIKETISAYTPAWMKDAWGSLGTWFTTQWDAIKGSVLVKWGEIKTLLNGDFSVENLVKTAWRGLGSWFASLGSEVVAAFQSIWAGIKSEVSTWPGQMYEVGEGVIDSLVGGLTGNKARLDLAQKSINDALGGGSSHMVLGTSIEGFDIGKSLTDGVIKGIESGTGGAAGAAQGLAGAVTDTTEDAFGIRSPSRVFAEIGRDLNAGLAVGIRDSAGVALGEAQVLAEEITATGQGALGFMGNVRSGLQGLFKTALTDAGNFRSSLGSMLSGWGNSLLDSAIGGIFDAVWPFANGGVINGGAVTPFAAGGVVSSPTFFPMRGGTGLMGEAGPEAIMPLARTGDGKLGVRAAAPAAQAVTSFAFAPQIDARGADVAAVARLEAQLRKMNSDFEARVMVALRTGRNRNLGVV